jgi:hypothetical protein
MKVSDVGRSILTHMVGAQSHIDKRDWGYRNFFASEPGSDDFKMLLELEKQCLVIHQIPAPGQSVVYFHCTEAGCKAAGLDEEQTNRAMGRERR